MAIFLIEAASHIRDYKNSHRPTIKEGISVKVAPIKEFVDLPVCGVLKPRPFCVAGHWSVLSIPSDIKGSWFVFVHVTLSKRNSSYNSSVSDHRSHKNTNDRNTRILCRYSRVVRDYSDVEELHNTEHNTSIK